MTWSKNTNLHNANTINSRYEAVSMGGTKMESSQHTRSRRPVTRFINIWHGVGSSSLWISLAIMVVMVFHSNHIVAGADPGNQLQLSVAAGSVTAKVTNTFVNPDCNSHASMYKYPTGWLRLALIELRAGYQGESDGDDNFEEEGDEDVYDEDDVQDEDEEEGDVSPDAVDHHLVRPTQSSSNLRGRPPKSENYDHKLAGPGSRQRNAPARKPRKNWTRRLVEGSVKFTGNVAWNTVRQSGKLAYNIVRPKHVDEYEIDGLWRLDQQIVIKRRRDEEQVLSSVATIRIDTRRHVIVVQQQQETTIDDQEGSDEAVASSKKQPPWVQPYRFDSTRLGSYQTKFVARAFLVGKDQVRIYGYKGTWQRKVADPKVLKLVGKIYNVRKLNPRQLQRQSKSSKDIVGGYQFVGKSIGTFVGRRRVQLAEDDGEDNEEDWEDVDDQPEDDDYSENEEVLDDNEYYDGEL